MALLTGCVDATAPAGDARRPGVPIALAPRLEGISSADAETALGLVDRVGVEVRRSSGVIAVDTTVLFPAGSDSVVLEVEVPVLAPAEMVTVSVDLRSGSRSMFSGTAKVTLSLAIRSRPPVQVPVVYTGPGADAKTVEITPRTVDLLGGATAQLSARVVGPGGETVEGVPLTWSSGNSAVAQISATGLVTAGAGRGTTTASVRLPTGLSDQVPVRITLPPDRIVVVSGDQQGGTVATPLAAPLAVKVLASDGVGVAGAPVSFRALAVGAAVSPASAVTDSTGRATATLTLGAGAGEQTFEAAVGTLQVRATATARAGPLAVIEKVAGDAQADTVGATLAVPISVRLRDAFGNPVVGDTVHWRGSLDGIGTPGTPDPTRSVSDQSGIASSRYTLGRVVGTESVHAAVFPATSSGVESWFTVTTRPGRPVRIAYLALHPPSGRVGGLADPTPVVGVSDAYGNPTPGVAVTFETRPGRGSLEGANQTTGPSGQAAVGAWTLDTVPGIDTVFVRVDGGTAEPLAIQATVTAGLPARLAIVEGQGGSGSPGASLAVAARLTDRFGNRLAGFDVVWWPTPEASMDPTFSRTDGAGVARTTVRLGSRVGAVETRAEHGGLAAPLSLTILPGSPVALDPASPTSLTGVAGRPADPIPAVRVLDGYGNPVPGTQVTFFTLPGNGAVTDGVVVTDGSGFASPAAWTLDSIVGVDTLYAQSPGLPGPLLFLATASAGPADAVTIHGGNAQADTAGQTLPLPLAVRVADAFGNPVSGVAVSWATVAGGGAPAAATTLSDATGIASVAYTLGPATGTESVRAAIPSGAHVDFALTATAAGVATPDTVFATTPLVLSGTAGGAASPVPQVLVRDGAGNPFPGAQVVFTATAGNGAVTGDTVLTDASGLASPSAWVFDTIVGLDTLVTTATALPGLPVQFVAVTAAGPATQLLMMGGDGQVGLVSSLLPSPMAVRALDAYGNRVGGASVTFTVTAGGGTPTPWNTTTDSAGIAYYDLTLGSAGTQTVQACLTGCSAPVTFSAMAIPVGTDATWAGTVSGAWSTAGNWVPEVVPSTTSNVFIPAGRPYAPALTGATQVARLVLEGLATLDLAGFTLTATGDVVATGATVSGGTLLLPGGSRSVSGNLPAVIVNGGGSVTVAGAVTTSGNVTVTSSATLTVGTGTMSVGGNFLMSGSGLLLMNDASGVFTVQGNAQFQDRDLGDGALTAGTLVVMGDLSAPSGNGQAFRAAGTHVTRLAGTANQSVFFNYPADNQSRFQNLEITNATGTVTFTSNAVARGDVTVGAGATVVRSGGTLFAAGQVTTHAASDLTGVTALAMYVAGSPVPHVQGGAPGTVVLQGGGTTTAPAGARTVPTNLTVNSGTTLSIGAGDLTVTGNFLMSGSGLLVMTNASGVFTVQGNAQFQDRDMGNTSLTAGTLVVMANLSAPSGNGQAFRAAGTHVTRLAGTANQSVSFVYPADGQSRFQNLEITNTGGTVTFSTEAVAAGTLDVASGATLVRSGVLYVAGQVTTQSGSDLSAVSILGIYASGAPLPLVQGTPPVDVRMQGGGTTAAPTGTRTIPTRLVITNGTVLDIGPNALVVTGSFLQNGGARLRMTDPAGQLTIQGNAQFEGVDMGDGSLTAGTLVVQGDLSAPSGFGQAFRAAGAHTTRFAGTATQSVDFVFPTDGQSRFQNVEVANPGGTVNFLNDHFIRGSLTVAAGATLARAGVVYVGGQVTSAATGSLSGVSTIGVYGSGAPLPLIEGPAPGLVRMQGGGTTAAVGGARTIPTSLTVTSSTVLNVGADTLTVTGSFLQTGGGRLQMTNAAGLLTIQGNAQFEGVDMGDGSLTAGTLVVLGDLTAPSSGNAQPFRAAGSHLTRLAGAAAQSVSFYYPALGSSRFQNLEITNASASGVTLGSNVPVAGDLIQLGRLSLGTTLNIVGTLSLGPASNTAVTGALTKGACVILPGTPGAVFSGFTCP